MKLVRFLAILVLFSGFAAAVHAQALPPDLALEYVSLSGDTAVLYRNDGAAISGKNYSITFQWVDASGTALAPLQTLSRIAIVSRGRELLTWNNTTVENTIISYEQRCYQTGGWFRRRTVCDTIQVPRTVTQTLAQYRAARPRPDALLAVVLDNGNRIAESNEGNNAARVGDTPFQGPPPAPVAELVITQANFDGQNLFMAFQNQSAVTIANQPFYVGLQWQDQTGQAVGDKRFIGFKNMPSGKVEVIDPRRGIVTLAQTGPGPNEVTVAEPLTAYLASRPLSAMRLQIIVDARDQILENTKTNNVATLVLPPLQLPDLAITRQVQIFNPQRLAFSYANLGRTPLSQATALSFWFEWVDAKGARVGNHLYWHDRDARSLPPGASAVFVSNGVQVASSFGPSPLDKVLQSPPPEAVSLKITIDGSNVFREADETNNVLVLPKPVRQLPDLVFGQIAPVENTLRVEVQNKGNIPAGPTDGMLVWLSSTGATIASGVMPSATRPIAPNASETVVLSLSGQRPIERMLANPPTNATRFQLVIDSTRHVAELNEDNNTAAMERSVLPVALPDLAITKQVQTLNPQQLMFSFMNASRTPLAPSVPLSFWFEWVDSGGARVSTVYWHDRSSYSIPLNTPIIFNSAGMYVNSSSGRVLLNSLLQNPPPLATQLKITIDGPNRFRETDESNNVALLPKPVVPLADLTFGAITGDAGVLKIEVKNQGVVPSAPTDVWLQWWSAAEPMGGNVAVQIPAPIAPKAVYLLSSVVGGKTPDGWLLSHAPQGATQLRLTVDGSGRIAESNEGNNSTTVDRATIPAVLPELTLTLATQVLRAKTDATVVGDQVRANLVAKNTGTVPASEITLFMPCPEGTTWVSTTANGASQNRNAGSGIAMPDLAVGKAHGLSVLCTIEAAAATKGSVRFTGSAQIKEVARAFNSNSVDITVKKREVLPKPDLEVDGTELLPTEDVVSGANRPFEAEFTAIVQNNSEVSAPASRARLRIDTGADGSWDTIPPAFENVDALDPDDTALVSWTVGWIAPLGRYAFEICVDTKNPEDELNKANNCTISHFTLEAGEEPIFDEDLSD